MPRKLRHTQSQATQRGAHERRASSVKRKVMAPRWRRGAAANQRVAYSGYRYRDGTTRPGGANDEQAQSDARARRRGGAGKTQPIGKQLTECQRDRGARNVQAPGRRSIETSKREAHTNVQATRSGERGRRETRAAPKTKRTRAYKPGSTSKVRPPEGSKGVTRVRSQPRSDTRSPRRRQRAAANQRAANGVPTERVGTGCASHTK